jgi:hypothetical protein
MPYNRKWAPKVVSKAFTINTVDTAGRFRVTGPLRKVRRTWVDQTLTQGSGPGAIHTVGVSNVSAVVEVDQPESAAGGTQLMKASGSTTAYSGETGVVWFEGD